MIPTFNRGCFPTKSNEIMFYAQNESAWKPIWECGWQQSDALFLPWSRGWVTFVCWACWNVSKQTTSTLFYCHSGLLAKGFAFYSLYLFMLWLFFYNHLHNLCLQFCNLLQLERSLKPTVIWINHLSLLFSARLIHKFHICFFRWVNPSCIRKMLCKLALYRRSFSWLIRSWLKLQPACLRTFILTKSILVSYLSSIQWFFFLFLSPWTTTRVRYFNFATSNLLALKQQVLIIQKEVNCIH